jgi:lipopolysaccharide export system protein LptA
MIGVVAGFYLYARYRVQTAIHSLPSKLGANIQQNTEGFTYSQSAGGHTIFSISASNAVRYKQGGKAQLHNVKIVSYGRESDRLDEITGDDFEYDAQSGDVTAKGKVGIELQAMEAGSSAADANANKVGSPVHLDTSGLVFNQKTGIAHTSELITFQLPEGAGSAMGATYDSKKNSFELHSDIHLLTSGPKPVNLRAASALFQQESQELTLTELHAESGIRRLEAQHVVLHLRPNNTVERADATGGVNGHVLGQRGAQLHAADASFTFGAQNHATNGRVGGGVTWETTGATASRGNADHVLLAFGPNNQIKSAQFRENVDVLQFAQNQNGKQPSISESAPNSLQDPKSTPPGTAVPQGSQIVQQPRGTEFHGDGLDLLVAGGTRLKTATSAGAAQIVLNSVGPGTASRPEKGTEKTVISASRFETKFSKDNRISTLAGSAPLKIVSSTPGQPDRISQSHDLLAKFSDGPTPTLQEAVQTGEVTIEEGQRSASADRATFKQTDNTMSLSGNVRYKDASTGAILTSNTLALNQATGETVASGDVKTTYAEQKAKPSGAMLSPSQAVHVTAPQMVAKSAAGMARYLGGARLWQGGDIVQAPIIEFNRSDSTLDAQAQGSQRVSTVFVQPEKNGKQIPVDVTADHLHYSDGDRKATLDGSLVLRSADSTLRAEKAVVTLRQHPVKEQAAKPTRADAPSELQTIEATGNIRLQQPGRRATGTRLVYTADEGKFVLTGTTAAPPSIFDAEHGQVTGVSLTFFNRDDRVLVDSSNSTSITQTRLKK